MTETLKKQKALIDGGFSDEEITQWQADQRKALSDAGFNQAEIDTEFGHPPLDPKPAAKVFEENIKKATAPETPDGEPKPITDFMGALEAGFQGSITGLLARGKNPDKTLAEDAPRMSRMSRIASSLGQLAGDVPAMVGGAIAGAGGGPVTATAGAFALPAGMRKVITDAYANGSAETFEEVWDRISGALIETGKGWITGAATGVAGKAAGMLPIASPTAKAAATVASEVATMVTVGKALEGQVPNANDFIDAAVVIGGVKGAVKTAGKIRDVYNRAGVKPDDMIADMEQDVTIGQDFVAENIEIPRAYGKVTATFESPERGLVPVEEAKPKTVDEQIKDIADELGQEAPEAMTTKAAQQKILSKISIGEHTDKEPMTFQKLYTDLVDDLNPIREAVKKAERLGRLPDNARTPAPTPPGTFAEPSTQTALPAGKPILSIDAQGLVKAEPVASNTLPSTEVRTFAERAGSPLESATEADSPYTLSTSNDPYQLARLTRGTFGKATQFLEFGTFDFKTYENNGPSLKDILQKGVGRDFPEITDIEKVDLNGFRAYIAAKRAVELDGRGIESGFDIEAAKVVVKNGKQYEAVARELTNYLNRLTKYLKDAGVVSEDAYKAMLDANKDYVPFFRVMDEYLTGAGLGRGVKTKNPIKSIEGSERNTIDPIESVIKNTYLYLSLAERNAVGNAFVKMAKDSGSPDIFLKKVAPEQRAVQLQESEIRALFDEFVKVRKTTAVESKTKTKTTAGDSAEPQSKQGKMVRERVLEALSARGFSKGEAEQMIARLESKGGAPGSVETLVKEIEKTEYVPEIDIRLPHEVATIFRAVKTPLRDNEIAVFENGKYQKYEVDPDVARAFNAADSQTAGLLTKILAIPAKALRAGAVLSPDFMGRNMIRDQTMAFVLSKGGYFPVFDFVRGAFSLARKDQDFQNWLKSGGANAALVSMDRQYIQQQLSTLTEVQGVMGKAWNVAKSPFEILRITSELIENATRLGEFKKVSGGLTEKAAIQEGGMAAREVTVDFARTGMKTRAMSLISAFFNAAVQGEDRVIRAFAEKPVGTTTKMMAAITLPSVLLYLSNRDDPRWQEIPRWQKDLFWIVFTEDHIYRIPKPHSAGIMFGSIPERMMEAYESDHPGAMKDLEKSFISAFFPNMIPTVAAPIVDQFANRSLFTGTPLIPAAQEKLLPEYQYTEYTTETAKAIGQILGAFPGLRERSIRDEDMFIGGVARALSTPILVENYVRSWTGGLGMYTLQLADKALRESGVLPDPVKPLETLSDLPVIKAFVVRYPSASAQSIQDFYDDYYAKKRVFDTKMELAKQGDLDAFDRVQNIDPSAWDEMAGIRDTLTQQSQLVRLIYKNPDFSPEDKRQLIDSIYYRMIELAKVGNDAMRELAEILGEP